MQPVEIQLCQALFRTRCAVLQHADGAQQQMHARYRRAQMSGQRAQGLLIAHVHIQALQPWSMRCGQGLQALRLRRVAGHRVNRGDIRTGQKLLGQGQTNPPAGSTDHNVGGLLQALPKTHGWLLCQLIGFAVFRAQSVCSHPAALNCSGVQPIGSAACSRATVAVAAVRLSQITG